MRKAVLLTVAVVFFVLALGGVALAASPQDVYNDYAADQKLDGTYTDAELQAFLDNALTIQYADPTIVAGLTTTVTALLNADQDDDNQGGDDQSTGQSDEDANSQAESRGTFPFTGAELYWFAVFAVVLIGGGLGLRRLGRARG